MRFTIVAVGRMRDKALGRATEEYVKRLSRYGRADVVEVREAKGADADTARQRESELLRAAAPQGAWVVVMDERGETVTSEDLAQRFEQLALHGRSHIALLIGGAFGHDPSLRAAADWVWSLTPLTLPHELARLVLSEQLYRAMTIQRGEPYHKV